MSGREVLFEMSRIGAQIKVVAIDATTGTEVAVVGPASLPLQALKQQAVNRLTYVLKRKAAQPPPR
jgi:hypothetical protein